MHIGYISAPDGSDGRFSADLGLFWVDLATLKVATLMGNSPGLTNGGASVFKGIELELKFRLMQLLALSANFSYNDARYRDFQTVINGQSVQLAGNLLPMSSHNLAGLGLTYLGTEGMQASLVANHVGNRFLDLQNEINVGSYITVEATVGYAFHGDGILITAIILATVAIRCCRANWEEGSFIRSP